MVDKLMRSFLKRRGYAVARRPGAIEASGYVLTRYVDANDDFDYKRYVAIQTDGNRRKIGGVFADEKTIRYISDFLKETGPVRNGLCHGSRNGAEIRWFQKELGVDVIGTDISDTAKEHGLVQWDFHETNPDWVGRFDFVYTNSHDHAYDPGKAFAAWVEQLAPNGKLIIEHTATHTASAVNELDPFGVEPELLPFVLLNFAQGRYAVTRLLQPEHRKRDMKIWLFIVQKIETPQMQA